MTQLRAGYYVFLGACCYGNLSTITKLGFAQGYSPADLLSSSTLLGCLLLWLYTLPKIQKIKVIPARTIVFLIIVGSIWGLTDIFYSITIKNLPASLAVILLFQFTWISQIVYMIQKRTWLTIYQWIALASVLFGTFLAADYHTNQLAYINWLGFAFGVCSAISYTASIFISDTVGLKIHSSIRSTLIVTGQLMLIWIIFPPTFLFTSAFANGLWIWAGLLGLVGIFVTTITYTKGIPHIGTSLAGILGSIELPMVLLLASWILHEQVGISQWVGVFFILVGIYISSRSSY
ncbi:EamA-like transporter family protein [Seinonella peptonophila]|uniref:EamA-like transporter family protein n=1 Tax=Seinonella peptonophila TaxID=112248 RepID=A0A1M4W6I3_9BACL|nr:DMT family transporter [Seinonella peptonophila]SHE76703.1 EamA-like transporter family protein [Seinonella peptonophila]